MSCKVCLEPGETGFMNWEIIFFSLIVRGIGVDSELIYSDQHEFIVSDDDNVKRKSMSSDGSSAAKRKKTVPPIASPVDDVMRTFSCPRHPVFNGELQSPIVGKTIINLSPILWLSPPLPPPPLTFFPICSSSYTFFLFPVCSKLNIAS